MGFRRQYGMILTHNNRYGQAKKGLEGQAGMQHGVRTEIIFITQPDNPEIQLTRPDRIAQKMGFPRVDFQMNTRISR